MTDDLSYQIEKIKGADILVGIPSYNNAKTIGHVVKAVLAGLNKYFPDRKSVLINSDGGSTDGTTDIVHSTAIEDAGSMFLQHQAEPYHKITTPYHGIPGKGSAFKTIFEAADALGTKACAVVDSDLRSITPEWVELLIKPVISGGFHYVAPLYHRHKYDGTITNSIVYPLTRALYGKRIRQPIGGDFGFSGSLAKFYLGKDVWDTDVARYGIDIWMTTTAIVNDFKVCQSFLGAKIHDPKDPGSDLSDMLYQVVGSAFDMMEDYYEVWSSTVGSVTVDTFGFHYAVGLEPVSVDVNRMIERFSIGITQLKDIYNEILSESIVSHLSNLNAADTAKFSIPDELWADIIYRFAVAAHKKVINRQHLLKSLTPLYIGRTASFVLETQDSDALEVENRIESMCRIFETKKPQLIEGWT